MTAHSRATFLPFALPDISDAEVNAVVETLRSGWLSVGPKTKQFEKAFAEYVGAAHAVAVNSATSGLHLALLAAGVGPGDEVITSTMTFTSTAATIVHCGARPVLVDITEHDYNLDVEALEMFVSPRTKAIVPVHFAGLPCDMDAIMAVARRHNLVVIEDAAHALPAAYAGKRIGTIGDMTVFSFYATKNLCTGEGGMITTNRKEFADKLALMSLHGISRDAWKRYLEPASWYYEVLAPGFKYNMNDMQASLGLVQLERLAAMTRRRLEIVDRYTAELSKLPWLELPHQVDGREHAWHLFVVRVKPDEIGFTRNDVLGRLRELNIGTSVHFIPLHLHPYYQEHLGYTSADFPVATRVFETCFSLPLYTKLNDADVDDVIAALRHITR